MKGAAPPWALAGLAALALVAPRSAAAGLDPRELFSDPWLREVEVSPSGELLALLTRRNGWDRVLVRHRDAPRAVLAFEQLTMLRRIGWIDDAHLIVTLGLWQDLSHRILRVNVSDGAIAVEPRKISVRGHIVKLLPERNGMVLWSVPSRTQQATTVYRAAIGDLLAAEGPDIPESERVERIARLGERVDYWVADRHAQIRAALVIEGPKHAELWYRASPEDDWRQLLEGDDLETFPIPLGVAENDRDLVVADRIEEEPRALYELDVESGELGEVLFAHPDADVTGVLYDDAGIRVIGVAYEEGGLEVYEHFDTLNDRIQRALDQTFPDAMATLLNTSRDRRWVVVLKQGARFPGTFYVLDTETNTAREIGRRMPWIDPEELTGVAAIRVPPPPDGELELDAFVTLPKKVSGKPPLVVMPHGGPRGVRDTRRFDPVVQYLAAGGLAVLQVNYRGSGGRGGAFLESGKRQWGRGIEDDVDAAVDELVALGWIDASRIGIFGGSYGGYSALISAIRRPDRYRCAASLNGPTDLPYLYHSFPYMKRTERGREYFEEHVGHPEDDYEELLSISPAYRTADLRVPVMLAQGSEDARVDVDHYYRMKTALEDLGLPHEGYVIEGGRHTPTNVEWVEFVARLRRFLLEHLSAS